MTTAQTEIYIKVNTNDMNVVNAMTKDIISKMSIEQLDLIEEFKVTQVMLDVEVNYDEYEEARQK